VDENGNLQPLGEPKNLGDARDVRRIAQGDAGVPEVQLYTRHAG